MARRKIFFVACLALSTLCLTAGYLNSGQWIGVVITLMTGLAWLLARKYPAAWLPHLCLLASVGLAVAGRLAGASPILMISGSGVALAAWDLLLLNATLENCTFGEQTRRYENKHLQSLALALGFGLFLALLGHWLQLQIPFVMLMLLVVLALVGLDHIWSTIKKSG
jgi:hypothetical protein